MAEELRSQFTFLVIVLHKETSNRIVTIKKKYIFEVETPPQHAICPRIQPPKETTLSDNKQGILCMEHLRGQLLIKSSVKKKNLTVNKGKHFTNCCKEITQGLMGFCGKTEGFVIA